MSKVVKNRFSKRLLPAPREDSSGVQMFHLPSGTTVGVTKRFYRFKLWNRNNHEGNPVTVDGRQIDTYGEKPILDFDGEPVFAELAILRILQNEGWVGVWVDSYRRGRFITGLFNPPLQRLPSNAREVLEKVKIAKRSRSGCWDVFAWRKGRLLFVEAKRANKDRFQRSQVEWLAASLQVGLPLSAFMVVEWDTEELG